MLPGAVTNENLMEAESVISDLLAELVELISCQEFDKSEVKVTNLSSSCFEFDEGAFNSPFKLNLKRRFKDNVDVLTSEPVVLEKRVKSSSARNVGYVFSPDLIKEVSRLPKVKGRAHQVHELIASYNLLRHLKILPARKASDDELRSFHSEEYIDYIKSCDGGNVCEEKIRRNESGINSHESQRPSSVGNAIENYSQEKEENAEKQGSQKEQEWDLSTLDTSQRGEEDFGLGYDCPLLPNMFNLVRLIAGSTLSAVESIIDGKVDIAINWAGGWHHALKDAASGFCYVNDIVIGILKLLSHGYTKVLYVDFDLHHGDGVELAFGHSNKVFTLSFHKYEVGFFPGTGSIQSIGPNGSKGKGYTMNVPLKDGISDENYITIAKEVLNKVIRRFQPQAIVAQFGADGLVSDPMNSFNLTPKSFVACLKHLKAFGVPLVILGGGGYNIPNTARCWTLLTAIASDCELEIDIPDSDPFFLTYGPSYELNIDSGVRKDENTCNDVHILLQNIRKNLNLLDSSS